MSDEHDPRRGRRCRRARASRRTVAACRRRPRRRPIEEHVERARPHALGRRVVPAAQEQARARRAHLDRSSCVIAAVTADLWVPQHFGEPDADRHARPHARRGCSRRRASIPWAPTTSAATSSRASSTARASRSPSASLAVVRLGAHRPAPRRRCRASTAGSLDALIMRLADVFLAFPYILFAILLLAVLPEVAARHLCRSSSPSGLLGWPSIARVFRSSILSVKENDYVDAGRALGASDCAPHARATSLPNAIAPIVVYATMSDRRRDPDRGGAVVPRPRHPAADALVGPHDRGRARRTSRSNPVSCSGRASRS